MAFVNRSERFISNKENDSLGPGVYELTKDNSTKIIKTEPEIPFSSLSPRKMIFVSKDILSNPSPGYYEPDKKEFPFKNKISKIKRDRSTELKNFLLYDSLNLNSLNKNKNEVNNPGPGTYDIPDSIGKIPKYLINQNNNKNMIRSNSASIEDKRVLSIPHCGMDYGYEISDDGEIKQSKNPLNLSPKNLNKISSKIKKSKGNIITSGRKYSSKITGISSIENDEDYKNYSIENSVLMNVDNNNQSKIVNKNSKVFKRERVNNKINEDDLLNNKDLSLPEKIDIILKSAEFNSSPGPGYYTSIDPNKLNYVNKRNVQNFGSLAKRFEKTEKIKKDEYLENNNNNENQEENKEKLFDRKKIDKLGIERDKKHEKELEKRKRNLNLEIVGPGSYNVSGNYILKSWNNKYNKFGSLSNRFEQKILENYPGPGHYEIQNKVQIEKKNMAYKKPNLFSNKIYNKKSNDFSPEDSIFQQKKKEKQKRILIDSVEYMFNNDKLNNEIRPVNILNKEKERLAYRKLYNMRLQEKENEANIGPGSYNIDTSDFNIRKKKGFIFSKSPRLNSQNNGFDNDNNVGPGSYYNDRYGDWIKPTHNILFV